jgi:hypothetical protein
MWISFQNAFKKDIVICVFTKNLTYNFMDFVDFSFLYCIVMGENTLWVIT